MTQDETHCDAIQQHIATGQELSPAQLVHIQQCRQCAVLRGNIQKLDSAFRQSTANLVPDGFLERFMEQLQQVDAEATEPYFPFSDKLLALFSHSRPLRTLAISLGMALGIGQLVQFILGIFFVSMMAAM